MTEFESLQSGQGLWDGLHRMWATPMAPCERSTSQALVLASTAQVAVVVALRWRTRDDAFDAVLTLRPTSGSSHKFEGRLCAAHPRLPVAVSLRGDSTERFGIQLHGEEDGRPWEVTVGRSGQQIALTVYDGAGCRPDYPSCTRPIPSGSTRSRAPRRPPSEARPDARLCPRLARHIQHHPR